MSITPKIRFRDEKGQSYPDWKPVEMGELYTERNERGNNDLPILSVSIQSGVSDNEEDEKTLGKRVKRSEDKSLYKRVYPGDLVFNMMRAWQGAIGTVKTEGMISPAYISARPNEDVYPDFMNYFMRTEKMIGLINRQSYGVTDFRKRLYWDSFANIRCHIPCIDEQKRITDFFVQIDALISTIEEQIQSLVIQKSETLKKVFSCEKRFQDINGEQYPAWQKVKIGNILTICHGKDYKHLGEGTIPVLGTGGVIGYVDTALCDWECVLIGRKGTIDKPQYMNTPFWSVDTLFYSKPRDGQNVKFQYYLFQNINWKKFNEATGVPSLSASTIENIEVEIPCIQEQEHIATFFTLFDETIESKKMVLEKWKRIRKGFLQQMFV